eukprot:1192043-Prorocentrum_minimum.AAC.1
MGLHQLHRKGPRGAVPASDLRAIRPARQNTIHRLRHVGDDAPLVQRAGRQLHHHVEGRRPGCGGRRARSRARAPRAASPCAPRPPARGVTKSYQELPRVAKSYPALLHRAHRVHLPAELPIVTKSYQESPRVTPRCFTVCTASTCPRSYQELPRVAKSYPTLLHRAHRVPLAARGTREMEHCRWDKNSSDEHKRAAHVCKLSLQKQIAGSNPKSWMP